MDPISTSVAAIVTGFLSKGAGELTRQIGEAASNAAQTLAQAVLDRLRADPAEERTVDRYERDPEVQRPALEAAVADLVAADAEFAARLQQLVAAYDEAKAGDDGIRVGGSVGGSIVKGNRNVVVDRNTGTVRLDREADED